MTAEHYIQMPDRPRRPAHPIWDVGCPCGWTGSAPSKKKAKQLWHDWHDAHAGQEDADQQAAGRLDQTVPVFVPAEPPIPTRYPWRGTLAERLSTCNSALTCGTRLTSGNTARPAKTAENRLATSANPPDPHRQDERARRPAKR